MEDYIAKILALSTQSYVIYLFRKLKANFALNDSHNN